MSEIRPLSMARRSHGHDVIVVGARCAGAGLALLLARRGLDVLVVDRKPYGADTLSTHALMRAAVLQLHRWGVLGRVIAAGTPPIRRTRFVYGAETVTVDIKPADGVEALYAPRRTVLDRILVDAARGAGAAVRFGTTMLDLSRRPDGRVDGVVLRRPDGEIATVHAGLVVGADGMRSTVARLVAAPVTREAAHTTAVLYGYWRGLDQPDSEWHFAPGVSAGVIPTNDDETCLFAGMPPARFRETRGPGMAGLHRRVIAEAAPAIAARVDGARAPEKLMGFAGLPGFLRRSHGPGWALVGDAGYFKDPITAHGISDALRDAELLADAIADGRPAALADYEATRDRLAGPLFEATDAIAGFGWDFEALKAHHADLSAAMKAEVADLAGRPTMSGAAA